MGRFRAGGSGTAPGVSAAAGGDTRVLLPMSGLGGEQTILEAHGIRSSLVFVLLSDETKWGPSEETAKLEEEDTGREETGKGRSIERVGERESTEQRE